MKKVFHLYQIDAFVIKSTLFSGNPAAVCILECDDEITDESKQKIASEVNQSMTAFVSQKWTKNENLVNNNDGLKPKFKIRFYTPTQEFAMCGHATLATSLLLCEIMLQSSDAQTLVYETKFGELLEAFVGKDRSITLSMPINIPKRISINDKWIEGLVRYTVGAQFDLNFVDEIFLSPKFLVICLIDANENYTYKVEPNFSQLRNTERKSIKNGIIVTQRANFETENIHFYSRVFLHWIGVDEDPVCGSAHSVLTPYWKQRLSIDGPIIGKQCSQRGGILNCSILEDRVLLNGNARIVYNANLYL